MCKILIVKYQTKKGKKTERNDEIYKKYKINNEAYNLRYSLREKKITIRKMESFSLKTESLEHFTLYAFIYPTNHFTNVRLETCLRFLFKFSLWRTLTKLRCIHFVIHSLSVIYDFPEIIK